MCWVEEVGDEVLVYTGSDESLVGRIEGPYYGDLPTYSDQQHASQGHTKTLLPGPSIATGLSGTSSSLCERVRSIGTV